MSMSKFFVPMFQRQPFKRQSCFAAQPVLRQSHGIDQCSVSPHQALKAEQTLKVEGGHLISCRTHFSEFALPMCESPVDKQACARSKSSIMSQ